jgi:hypothetical protein
VLLTVAIEEFANIDFIVDDITVDDIIIDNAIFINPNNLDIMGQIPIEYDLNRSRYLIPRGSVYNGLILLFSSPSKISVMIY